MAKLTEKIHELLPRTWSPNQVVAHNVTRARLLRGWTQEEASRALAPYLGAKLSHASFSAIERSIAGGRVKQFSADELVALSRAFNVPLGWWFTPPSEGALCTPDHQRTGVDFAQLVDFVLGTPDTLPAWIDALQAWAAGRAESGPTPSAEQNPSGRANEQTERRARVLIRSRFGDLGEARHVLRRLADLLEDLDQQDSADTDPQQPTSKRLPGSRSRGATAAAPKPVRGSDRKTKATARSAKSPRRAQH